MITSDTRVASLHSTWCTVDATYSYWSSPDAVVRCMWMGAGPDYLLHTMLKLTLCNGGYLIIPRGTVKKNQASLCWRGKSCSAATVCSPPTGWAVCGRIMICPLYVKPVASRTALWAELSDNEGYKSNDRVLYCWK